MLVVQPILGGKFSERNKNEVVHIKPEPRYSSKKADSRKLMVTS
jgi:hypothetical protein